MILDLTLEQRCNATLNTGSAVTTTLTTAQSGTIFEVDGTDDID